MMEAKMNAEQVQANVCGPEEEPNAQPVRTTPRWRGSSMWLLACLGGGGLLLAALLAWGHWEFGSLANTLAYLNGERLLVDPRVISFGAVRRGEERDLHVTIRNRTGEEVKIIGAKSNCGCMATVEQFPCALANGDQREFPIHIWFTGNESTFEKRVDFYTDDDAKPVIAVVVRGKITD
jgi:hypothetical protein